MSPDKLRNEIMHLGKQCAVEITGFPEDGEDITSPQQALMAIRECLRLGKESHNQLNALRLLEGMDVLEASALGTFLKGGDIPHTIDAARGVLVKRLLEAEKKLK